MTSYPVGSSVYVTLGVDKSVMNKNLLQIVSFYIHSQSLYESGLLQYISMFKVLVKTHKEDG